MQYYTGCKRPHQMNIVLSKNILNAEIYARSGGRYTLHILPEQYKHFPINELLIVALPQGRPDPHHVEAGLRRAFAIADRKNISSRILRLFRVLLFKVINIKPHNIKFFWNSPVKYFQVLYVICQIFYSHLRTLQICRCVVE